MNVLLNCFANTMSCTVWEINCSGRIELYQGGWGYIMIRYSNRYSNNSNSMHAFLACKFTNSIAEVMLSTFRLHYVFVWTADSLISLETVTCSLLHNISAARFQLELRYYYRSRAWLMPLASKYHLLFRIMCKPRLKCSLGSLARLSTLS